MAASITVGFRKERLMTPFRRSDLSQWLYQAGKNSVKIVLTNNRELDEAAANELCNYAKTPENYTWHHSEDLGVMQLVETVVNRDVAHTGGFAIFKALLSQLGVTFNLLPDSSI